MKMIIHPNDFFNDQGLKIANEASFFSPQLFYKNIDHNRVCPLPLGSSILVTVNDRFFLITAAHLFTGYLFGKEIEVARIGTMLDDEFCRLGGDLIICDPQGEEIIDQNKIDTAVFELNDETVNLISRKYKFLPWSKLHFAHEASENITYLVLGFPQDKKVNLEEKKIQVTPLVLAANGIIKQSYFVEGIDEDKIIALSINCAESELPKLEGISGCGVWIVFNKIAKNPEYKLVSIVTGCNSEVSVLYSIRIEALRMILRKRFDVMDI